MGNLRKVGLAVLSVGVVAGGLCLSAVTFKRWMGIPGIRKADVVLSITPQAVDEARAGCPIPLPDSAHKVQYAVWSFGEVTQSWVRFEAPVPDCLAHAERMVQPFRDRDGYAVTTTPIVEDTGVLCVLDPTEVNLTWFEECQKAPGTIFRVSGGRAPVIWVDTGRGVFYCEIKNECHSLSPP